MLANLSRATLVVGIVATILIPAGAGQARPPAADISAKPSVAVRWDTEHVMTRRVDANGNTYVREYQVAPGHTAPQLYAELRAQGVANLVDPTARPASAATDAIAPAATCTYGGAVGFTDTGILPCIAWRFNGWSDPQVYFRDHSGAAWPVTAVVAKWHEAVGIDSYYIWKSTACPSTSTGKHCVNVYSEWSTSPSLGWIDYAFDPARKFIDGSVNVHLNDRLSGEDNRSTACEELGHALGVGHNYGQTDITCMGQSIPGPDPANPGSNDYGLLRYVVYP